jgi:hypothetical protein
MASRRRPNRNRFAGCESEEWAAETNAELSFGAPFSSRGLRTARRGDRRFDGAVVDGVEVAAPCARQSRGLRGCPVGGVPHLADLALDAAARLAAFVVAVIEGGSILGPADRRAEPRRLVGEELAAVLRARLPM